MTPTPAVGPPASRTRNAATKKIAIGTRRAARGSDRHGRIATSSGNRGREQCGDEQLPMLRGGIESDEHERQRAMVAP